MTFEQLKKVILQREDSVAYIDALLSRMWSSGCKVYLICLGSLSKGEYRALAKEFNTEVLATKSILGRWLGFISWIIPGSYIGAMQVHSDSSAWSKQVIDLAGEGYVVLVMSEQSEIEQIVTNAVQTYSLSKNFGEFYELFKKLKICIVNAEDQTSVDIETNVGSNG